MGLERLRVVAVLTVGALGCARTPEPPPRPAEVRYDGATSISRKILVDVGPDLQARSGVALRMESSGAGIGLRRMLAGEVEVAGVARSLTPAELGYKPYFQIIGYDALGIFVNAANPIRSLTRAQITAIFTGATRSWKPFGGKDLAVAPCTERLASERATLEALQTLALDGAPYSHVKELEDPSDCLDYVAKEPGGICAASTTYAIPGVRAVLVDDLEPSPSNVRASRYALTRPLLLVTREPPSGPVALLFDMALSPQGQAAVARAGFVPAR